MFVTGIIHLFRSNCPRQSKKDYLWTRQYYTTIQKLLSWRNWILELDTRAETEGYMNIEELNDKSEEDWTIITEILRILKSGGNYRRVNFKTVNQRQIVEITNRINKILDKILTRTIAEMNNLINAVMIYVA